MFHLFHLTSSGTSLYFPQGNFLTISVCSDGACNDNLQAIYASLGQLNYAKFLVEWLVQG